jgi:hypothetical protein
VRGVERWCAEQFSTLSVVMENRWWLAYSALRARYANERNTLEVDAALRDIARKAASAATDGP